MDCNQTFHITDDRKIKFIRQKLHFIIPSVILINVILLIYYYYYLVI